MLFRWLPVEKDITKLFFIHVVNIHKILIISEHRYSTVSIMFISLMLTYVEFRMSREFFFFVNYAWN